MRGSRALAALAVGGLLLTGCDSSPGSGEAGGRTSAAPGENTLRVYAAASLQTTLTAIGAEFEAEHPGTTVAFTFAGSSALVTQLAEGAPADVFASADETTMARATAAELTEGEPVDFATNLLEIATPPGNPTGVTSFADLADPDRKVVVCAGQVPCGAAVERVEDHTGVTLDPVSEESSVTDVLGKVATGEADAGLVYVTDVLGAGDAVTGVPFPESAQAVNTYPAVALADAAQASLAAEFVDFLRGSRARAVLTAAGFGTPAR